MDGEAIDWLTELVLAALARDESISPAALRLILQRYVVTGRDELRNALGTALARALDRWEATPDLQTTPDLKVGPTAGPTAGSTVGPTGGPTGEEDDDRAGWLMVFLDASELSEDERVVAAAESLVADLRGGWPSRGGVGSAMQSIDACLSAAGRLASTTAIVPAAIDELERVVGHAYQPGEGLLRSMKPRSEEPGALRDHVAAASALLTAFAITGRLPYSMLAEELLQFTRRTWWDEVNGGFGSEFAAGCDAARVLCRLAALHADSEYRETAVIANRSDYADDARRTLESLAPRYRDHGLGAAVYGLALAEWLALGGNLQ